MTKQQIIANHNSLSLAYVGDAVYELLVREFLLQSGLGVNGTMHKRAKDFVSAHAQSTILQTLDGVLNDDEKGVVRRGRNVKSHSHPKNADLSEYHNATGFEALWGYLHLAGDTDRINELFDIIKKSV